MTTTDHRPTSTEAAPTLNRPSDTPVLDSIETMLALTGAYALLSDLADPEVAR